MLVDMLTLNTLADVKTKLNNIGLKMLFIEQQSGNRTKTQKVINGVNYEI